ncbi:MAG: hypothetical protein KAI33_00220, partial [Elusimicrobiales bacterium]|nr:hypothetical protein [Elusimicrobiales bacterium]
ECKKLVEIQKNASNNMSKIKTDLQSGIKRNFSEEGELFRKEMEEFSFRFAEEYKRLNEMQKAALSNTADIKNDLNSAIKRSFSEERELFEKEMEEVSLKLAEEHKNMNEIQNVALDTAFEVKTDLQCAIKKHFNDERDLFRKEMEDVSFKFAGEYKKLDKILNRLNNMNIVDDKIQAFLKRMEVVIAEGENSLLNRASMENKKLLLKMKEFCASTSREMFSVEAISHYLNEFHGKASGIGKNLEQLVKEIDTLRFEPILGASGIAVKREFEFLRNGLLELRNETESFNNLKDKIEQVVGNLPKKDEKK